MNEDLTGQQSSRRTFCVSAIGDTASEIELAALDAARAFFGPDVRLEVAQDYNVVAMSSTHPLASSGKKYCASTVCVTAGPWYTSTTEQEK